MSEVTAFGRLPGPKAPPAATFERQGHTAGYVAGGSGQQVEDIGSLAELGRKPHPHRLRLAPPIAGPAPLPLFDEGKLPEEIVHEHHAVHSTAINVYGLPDHELGGGGFLQSQGRLFLGNDVLPGYYANFLMAGSGLAPEWAGALYDPAATVLEVDAPVALAFHPNLTYGHFLLEMLPRLHLLSRLRRAGRPFLTAAHDRLPGWARAVLALYFAPEEIVEYKFGRQRVRSPCFIVPSMMHAEHRFHPDFNLAIDELRDFLLPKMPPSPHRRVWLSRRGHAGLHGMVNEDAVEATVAGLGFTVIDPLALSFPEQLALMEGAEVIAGAYGSAMHTAMFARRGTRIFCVNRANWYQSAIAVLRSQPLAYLPAGDGEFRDWRVQGTEAARYVVDCERLSETMRRFERGG